MPQILNQLQHRGIPQHLVTHINLQEDPAFLLTQRKIVPGPDLHVILLNSDSSGWIIELLTDLLQS